MNKADRNTAEQSSAVSFNFYKVEESANLPFQTKQKMADKENKKFSSFPFSESK